MPAWLDLLAGAAFLAVAAVASRGSPRYAVLALLAALAWFAGDLDDRLLLIHRPLMLHAALAYSDARLHRTYPRLLVAVSWVAALVPALSVRPAWSLALAALIGAEAWQRQARPDWGRRRAGSTASQATALLGLSLAAPALVRLGWWPGEVQAEVLIVVYAAFVVLAGAVLLTGLLLRSADQETDAVIELSDATPGETLAALRRESASRPDPQDRAVLEAAVALLESNAALQADLAEKVEEVRASRTRIVETAAHERRRLERLLADGALTYLDELTAVLHDVGTGNGSAGKLATACLEEVGHIREDLNQLARGLHPRTLAEHGLAVALAELAARSPLPIAVVAPDGRFPVPAETAIWYGCSEAITNLTKHARAARASVEVHAGAQQLTATIRDDGVGGARMTPGGGLAGLADRLAAVGGSITINPAPGGGTDVHIQVSLT